MSEYIVSPGALAHISDILFLFFVDLAGRKPWLRNTKPLEHPILGLASTRLVNQLLNQPRQDVAFQVIQVQFVQAQEKNQQIDIAVRDELEPQHGLVL